MAQQSKKLKHKMLILLSFELDVISTYFPDFDNEVSDWLSGNYIQVEKYT